MDYAFLHFPPPEFSVNRRILMINLLPQITCTITMTVFTSTDIVCMVFMRCRLTSLQQSGMYEIFAKNFQKSQTFNSE